MSKKRFTRRVEKDQEIKMGEVQCKALNVRADPDQKADVVGILFNKEKIYIIPDELSIGTGFIRIRAESGAEGYAMSQYILRK